MTTKDKLKQVSKYIFLNENPVRQTFQENITKMQTFLQTRDMSKLNKTMMTIKDELSKINFKSK